MDNVSIIIVNWNGKKYLSECLDGLRQQIYQPQHITLIDNCSSDGSVDFVVRNYPEVNTISLPKNLGFSTANNIVLRDTQTEYVGLLNNDVVAHPLWLKNLLDALKTHPVAGFAASKMVFYDHPEIIDRAGDGYTKAGTGLLRGRGKPEYSYNRKEWVFGACAGASLYRTCMLDDIGLFDEDFFLLFEDVDLSFRAQLRGYKCLYVPEAIVYHRASSSIVYDSPLSVYYGHRNLEWVYIKNMPSGMIVKTIFPHLIYDIAAFLYFSINGRIKHFIKSKWDALKGIKKMFKKRRKIQKNKKVDDCYIWDLLEKELFLPRLKRRLW